VKLLLVYPFIGFKFINFNIVDNRVKLVKPRKTLTLLIIDTHIFLHKHFNK